MGINKPMPKAGDVELIEISAENYIQGEFENSHENNRKELLFLSYGDHHPVT